MLATEFALRGYKVLLIDGDPQANASAMFLNPAQVEVSLSEVLIARDGTSPQKGSLDEVMVSTEVETLDLVPATISLAHFDRSPPTAMFRLKRLLQNVAYRYDFAIIDTPPNLGMLLSAALTAADHVIIPVQAAPLAYGGLDDLLYVINQEVREANPGIQILGAVCTLLDRRTTLGPEVFVWLKEKFPNKTFETIIHRAIKLEELPIVHQPIQLFAPKSKAAEQYAALADEVLDRLGVEGRRGQLKAVPSSGAVSAAGGN